MLTKNVWFPQAKCELSSQEIIDMKDILSQMTTQDGQFTAEFSCLYQDLIGQIKTDKFGKEMKRWQCIPLAKNFVNLFWELVELLQK